MLIKDLKFEILKSLRSVVSIARGGMPPTADANVARTAVIAADHVVTDFGLTFLPDTYCDHGHPLHLSHHERAIAAGIAAGAAEIQLNLVAQDFLKLPREARA